MLDSVTTQSNETNVQLLQPNWEIKVKHDGKDKTNTYYVEATNNNLKLLIINMNRNKLVLQAHHM